MAKGIKDLKSQTLANFASPNLFRVVINQNNPTNLNLQMVERMSFVCHTANIPGLTMVTTDKDLAYRSNVRQKTYDDISLTFYCNDDMLELEYFQKWMEQMVDPETNRVGFYNNYVGTIRINKMSRQTKNINDIKSQNATTLVTQLNDAYPKRIEPLTLDYSSNGTLMSLSVNFSYRNYEQVWIPLNTESSEEIRGEPIASRSTDSKTNPMQNDLDKTKTISIFDQIGNGSNNATNEANR